MEPIKLFEIESDSDNAGNIDDSDDGKDDEKAFEPPKIETLADALSRLDITGRTIPEPIPVVIPEAIPRVAKKVKNINEVKADQLKEIKKITEDISKGNISTIAAAKFSKDFANVLANALNFKDSREHLNEIQEIINNTDNQDLLNDFTNKLEIMKTVDDRTEFPKIAMRTVVGPFETMVSVSDTGKDVGEVIKPLRDDLKSSMEEIKEVESELKNLALDEAEILKEIRIREKRIGNIENVFKNTTKDIEKTDEKIKRINQERIRIDKLIKDKRNEIDLIDENIKNFKELNESPFIKKGKTKDIERKKKRRKMNIKKRVKDIEKMNRTAENLLDETDELNEQLEDNENEKNDLIDALVKGREIIEDIKRKRPARKLIKEVKRKEKDINDIKNEMKLTKREHEKLKKKNITLRRGIIDNFNKFANKVDYRKKGNLVQFQIQGDKNKGFKIIRKNEINRKLLRELEKMLKVTGDRVFTYKIPLGTGKQNYLNQELKNLHVQHLDKEINQVHQLPAFHRKIKERGYYLVHHKNEVEIVIFPKKITKEDLAILINIIIKHPGATLNNEDGQQLINITGIIDVVKLGTLLVDLIGKVHGDTLHLFLNTKTQSGGGMFMLNHDLSKEHLRNRINWGKLYDFHDIYY